MWRNTLFGELVGGDGTTFHVDARNGDLLFMLPTRVPGIISFETAQRVIEAPEKQIDLWDIKSYERITTVDGGGQTPDSMTRGRLLWRAGNGTLYKVGYPHISDVGGVAWYIEAPEDTEDYHVWELITEDQIYVIHASLGIIKLMFPYPEPTASPSSPGLENTWYVVIVVITVIAIIIVLSTYKSHRMKNNSSKSMNDFPHAQL